MSQGVIEPEVEREAPFDQEERRDIADTGRKRARKRRAMKLIGSLALVLLLLAIAWSVLHRRPAARERATEKVEVGPASTVKLAPAQLANVATEIVLRRSMSQEITTPGKVAIRRMTPVFSQFSGRLVQLRAEIGDRVRAGRVLGVIDSPDIIGLESDYQQAFASLSTARTSFDLARRTRERAERLANVDAIPKRELQQAQADEARAADDLRRAQAALIAARERLRNAGVSEAEIERLESGARAVSRLVPLVAPINGVIIERHVGLGQMVQSNGGDPLFMIADLSSVWVNADIYEDQLAYVRVGSPLKIKAAAYPDRIFNARVDQIGSVVDPEKHTIPLRCVVANPGELLKPGMFVTVILRTATLEDVLTVPNTAIVTEGERHIVFVETSPGEFVRREVQVGEEREGRVIIRSGLREGERVVTNGSLLLDAERRMEGS